MAQKLTALIIALAIGLPMCCCLGDDSHQVEFEPLSCCDSKTQEQGPSEDCECQVKEPRATHLVVVIEFDPPTECANEESFWAEGVVKPIQATDGLKENLELGQKSGRALLRWISVSKV